MTGFWYFQEEGLRRAATGRLWQLVHAHMEAIKEAQNSLRELRWRLEETDDIEPLECDEGIKALRALRDAARGLVHLLQESGMLPTEVAAKRYQILTTLHYIEEQITLLLSSVATFRSVCRERAQETYLLHARIVEELAGLLEVSEDLEPEGKELLGRVVIRDQELGPRI